MSDVKKATAKVVIGKREYEICLTLNLIDVFQERYGELTNIAEKSQDMKELIWIITQFINEAIDEHNDDFPDDKWQKVDENYIKRKVKPFENLKDINNALLTAFKISTPENEDDDFPNLTATK